MVHLPESSMLAVHGSSSGTPKMQSISGATVQLGWTATRLASSQTHWYNSRRPNDVAVGSSGGNLITSHIVFDETTGMSATMKTFERSAAEKRRRIPCALP